jgi:type IV pilus assembly protein PilQ
MKIKIILFICFITLCLLSKAQTNQDRFKGIEQKLEELSVTVPGLKQKVDFSVTGISIQDFLRAMAESNTLNISVDPKINVRVFNNFNNEEARNILVFMCKEYDLDIRFVGSILSIVPYQPPVQAAQPFYEKPLEIDYDPEQKLLSFSLRKDTLYKVLESITRKSKRNVILDPEVSDVELISGFIQQIPLENALEKLAYTNNLLLEVSPDSIFIFKRKPKGEDLLSNTSTSKSSNRPTNKSSNNSYKPSTNGNFFLEVKDSIYQKFISFSGQELEINEVIQAVSRDAGKDFFIFSQPKGKVNLTVSDISYQEFLTFLLKGSDYTYRVEGGIYLIGDRKAEGLRETKVMKLEYRSFTDIEKAIPAELRKGVEIKEFPELNSFILSGSAPQIAEIEKITKSLDQVVPLIMIEVILVDIKKGKMLKTGVSAGLSDTTSGGTILPGLDLVLSSASLNKLLAPINLGRVTKNFYVGLSALDQQDYADVQSMPKLATLNSHKANMTIGETRYYLTETQNVIGNVTSSTVVTQQWNSVQANLAINITPVVSGDEHVTLDISIEVSDFIGNPPANSPPPSSSRNFTSLIRVMDGEMVLLGGMERTSKTESGSGFPILSRIPIIKWFFSSKSKAKAKSISYVFISPRIVY